MNKERLGDFIGSERKNLGLTQRDLAARLHVTDKAVSKWERGLSYPDVTLLEPLAAALDLTVEELMACRRQAAKGAEETMQSLLDISRDSVRQERRRSWQRLAAVLVLLAVTAAVVAYTQIVVTEEREDYFVLKETVDGANYLYVELPWEGRLLRLRCVGDVDFDGITLEDEFGCEVVYDLDCRWNRLTYTGTVSRCAPSGSVVVGHMEGSSSGTSSVEVFGMRDVLYAEVDYHQNPHGEGFLCDAAYWLPDGPVDPGLLDVIVDGHPGYPVDYGAALLVVENCVSSTFGSSERRRSTEIKTSPSESGGWGLLPPGGGEPASGLSQPGAGPPPHRPVHRAAVPASIGTKRGPGFRQDLFLYEQDCKPGSVSNSHLSRRTVAGTLQPPRERPGQP